MKYVLLGIQQKQILKCDVIHICIIFVYIHMRTYQGGVHRIAPQFQPTEAVSSGHNSLLVRVPTPAAGGVHVHRVTCNHVGAICLRRPHSLRRPLHRPGARLPLDVPNLAQILHFRPAVSLYVTSRKTAAVADDVLRVFGEIHASNREVMRDRSPFQCEAVVGVVQVHLVVQTAKRENRATRGPGRARQRFVAVGLTAVLNPEIAGAQNHPFPIRLLGVLLDRAPKSNG